MVAPPRKNINKQINNTSLVNDNRKLRNELLDNIKVWDDLNSKYDIDSKLISKIELNYSYPFDVQRIFIPKILEGNNVLCQASTGLGKTLAYAIPSIDIAFKNKYKKVKEGEKDEEKEEIKGLKILIITLPHLVHQTYDVLKNINPYNELSIKRFGNSTKSDNNFTDIDIYKYTDDIYKGNNKIKYNDILENPINDNNEIQYFSISGIKNIINEINNTDILITSIDKILFLTKINDYFSSNNMSLYGLKLLNIKNIVLDEYDNYYNKIANLSYFLGDFDDDTIKYSFFTATMSKEIEERIKNRRFEGNIFRFEFPEFEGVNKRIKHYTYFISSFNDKVEAIKKILDNFLNKSDKNEKCIIFCNDKNNSSNLKNILCEKDERYKDIIILGDDINLSKMYGAKIDKENKIFTYNGKSYDKIDIDHKNNKIYYFDNGIKKHAHFREKKNNPNEINFFKYDPNSSNENSIKFKNNDDFKIMITSTLDRGYDCPNIKYVLIADLKEEDNDYIHKAGRCARGIDNVSINSTFKGYSICFPYKNYKYTDRRNDIEIIRNIEANQKVQFHDISSIDDLN